jgi:hypothetical protein
MRRYNLARTMAAEQRTADGKLVAVEAGAYTRPLFSST